MIHSLTRLRHDYMTCLRSATATRPVTSKSSTPLWNHGVDAAATAVAPRPVPKRDAYLKNAI